MERILQDDTSWVDGGGKSAVLMPQFGNQHYPPKVTKYFCEASLRPPDAAGKTFQHQSTAAGSSFQMARVVAQPMSSAIALGFHGPPAQ